MKKRLRKKLKKGEFKEFGFHIKIIIDPNLNKVKIDDVTWDFIINAIEANDLMFGGGGDHIYKGFCCKIKGSATEKDVKSEPCNPIDIRLNTQQAVDDFPINHPDCKSIAGRLTISGSLNSDISSLSSLSQLAYINELIIEVSELLSSPP